MVVIASLNTLIRRLFMQQTKDGPQPVLHHFSILASTNDYARELLKNGSPLPAAILADRQSAGRGRRGRSFFSDDCTSYRRYPS